MTKYRDKDLAIRILNLQKRKLSFTEAPQTPRVQTNKQTNKPCDLKAAGVLAPVLLLLVCHCSPVTADHINLPHSQLHNSCFRGLQTRLDRAIIVNHSGLPQVSQR